MIIDAHTHIFPDKIAAKAVVNMRRNSPVPLASNGTLNGLLESMVEAQITRSVVLPVSTKPEQVKSINRFAVELRQNQKIIPIGSLHPKLPDLRNEIKRLKDHGIRGVKMHPDYQAFFVDDEKIFPIYEALAAEELILYLHAGKNINLPDPPCCTPERLARVAKIFPQLKLVAAHLGGWRMWDDVERYLVGTDVWFDTSFVSAYINQEQFLKIIRNHGVEKIIFGTDSPWNGQSKSVREIMNLPLPKHEMDLILGQNAAKLFE